MPTTLKEFETVFPRLVEDLTAHCKSYGLPEKELKWYEKVGRKRLIEVISLSVYETRLISP
jgi:hypothetical protein